LQVKLFQKGNFYVDLYPARR